MEQHQPRDVLRRPTQRFEAGDYAVVATKVAATGLVDKDLQTDSVYYYRVRACNHLGCTEYSDVAVAGITESEADVSIPAAPKDVRVVRKEVAVFPDVDEVTWTAVEGATYYEVYRAGDLLTEVSAPLNISSHTDLGRSLNLSFGTYYQVRACNKGGLLPIAIAHLPGLGPAARRPARTWSRGRRGPRLRVPGSWLDAGGLVDDVNRLLSSFEILEDGLVVTESLIALCRKVSVGGRQIHNANIVATMLAHGERRTPGKAKRARLCR